MAQQYDFGMIGLGVMGSNLLLNMADNEFAVIGYDLKPERGRALEAAAEKGTIVKGINDLAAMMAALKRPRKIMMLVPAGPPVDAVITNVLPFLEEGDILIDGGNSFFQDTLKRITYLHNKKIHFFGMGVSGGELGARTGPSLMPGGDREAYQYLKPILEAIAAKADGKPCVEYMGNGAAGHYVKMVHNGIEYAMMQMLAEVYDVMRRGLGFSNKQLNETFARWHKGPLNAYLVGITASVFNTKDTETDQYLVDMILDQAGSKGTGKWTSQNAMDLSVPLPAIDMAVAMRDMSVYKEQRIKAAALYQQEAAKIKASKETFIQDLEAALHFSFLVAYVQGMSMLAKASTELKMNIPLPDVVRVWKAGCIIRSAMLNDLEKAFEKDRQLANLLLDPGIASIMKEKQQAVRNIIAAAVEARIPIPAIMSCIGYFDAFTSERLPINLIQAQRDYFGAHTYRRTDREGVFHTEWHSEGEAG
jgi:6-phosphogluconate dehydrogenase